jgi:leucyl/phenylalanyl-tRNA--protein transferase
MRSQNEKVSPLRVISGSHKLNEWHTEPGGLTSRYVGCVVRSRVPRILRAAERPDFPDPTEADARGLVAAGGLLTPNWLLDAYKRGIFPWYDAGMPPLWWSPDPRCVVDADSIHISRSMRRFLRTTQFTVSFNRAFADVMRGCAEERESGTWILPEMIEAYTRLRALGCAHSVEVWQSATLVGGLYGVQHGGLFAAESMFHRETNASKLALIAAVQNLFAAGVRLFDVQFLTPHLESLGAYTVPRTEYLARLGRAVGASVDLRPFEHAFPFPT